MDKKKGILRFFNLFDIILIGVIVILAVVLVFLSRTGEVDESSSHGTVTYVLELRRMENGSEEMVKAGDRLTDKIKKYDIGTVTNVEIKDAVSLQDDILQGASGDAVFPSGKDVYVTVEAPCTESGTAITVGGGYTIRVGRDVSVRGPGYFGAGYIIDIVREGDGA